MNHLQRLVLGSAVLVLLLGSSAWAQGNRSDEEVMKLAREMNEQYDRNFNAADAHAMAEAFAEDGDVVLALGETARGRTEIEQAYKKLFAENKGARNHNEVLSARLIKPDVLIIDVTYELSIASRPSKGHIFTVSMKRDGKWQTVSQRTYPALRER